MCRRHREEEEEEEKEEKEEKEAMIVRTETTAVEFELETGNKACLRAYGYLNNRGGVGGGRGESTADVASVRAGKAVGGSVRAKARAVTAAVCERAPFSGSTADPVKCARVCVCVGEGGWGGELGRGGAA